MRICLNCGTAVAATSTTCSNCGAAIQPEQVAQLSFDQQPMSGTSFSQSDNPASQGGRPTPPQNGPHSPTVSAGSANSGYTQSGQPGSGQSIPPARPARPGYNPQSLHGSNTPSAPSSPAGSGGPGYNPPSLSGNAPFAPAGPGNPVNKSRNIDEISTVHTASTGLDNPGNKSQSIDEISTVHMPSTGPASSGHNPQNIDEISTVPMPSTGPANPASMPGNAPFASSGNFSSPPPGFGTGSQPPGEPVQSSPSLGFPPAWATPSEKTTNKWKLPLPLDRRLIAFGLVAIILVGGGLSLMIYAATSHSGKTNVQATATTNGTSSTIVQDPKGTPSAQQALYTQSTAGSAALSSPLKAQDGASWDVYNAQGGGGCAFTGSSLHASVDHADYYVPCFAQKSSYTNMALQAQLTIVKGDEGGLIFRGNSNASQYYIFRISQNGDYGLYLVKSSSDSTTLVENSSKAINQGVGQTNLLTVIAKGKDIYLYVNKQYVDHVSDSTYTSGSVGIFGSSNQNPTDTSFSNVQVWKLN